MFGLSSPSLSSHRALWQSAASLFETLRNAISWTQSQHLNSTVTGSEGAWLTAAATLSGFDGTKPLSGVSPESQLIDKLLICLTRVIWAVVEGEEATRVICVGLVCLSQAHSKMDAWLKAHHFKWKRPDLDFFTRHWINKTSKSVPCTNTGDTLNL